MSNPFDTFLTWLAGLRIVGRVYKFGVPRELRLRRRDHLRHAIKIVCPIQPERRLNDWELHDQFQARRSAWLEIRAGLKLQRAIDGCSRKLLLRVSRDPLN